MPKSLTHLLFKTVIGVAILFVLLFIVGGVFGYLSAASDLPLDGALTWVIGLVAVAIMAAGLVLGARWMGVIDEAAREAHKWAWYWGGTAGMSIGGVGIILALALPGAADWTLPAIMGRTDPAIYLGAGGFALMMLMCIGYIVAWAFWWFTRGRG